MQGYISSVGNLSSQQGGDIDTFINITVDLTGVTSSQTVNIKGKTYNQYMLTDNNITVKTITSLSDIETIQISDLLHYKLFALSSNNNDTGLYLSYDGTTLTAYVATNNIGMTTVDFYFTYIYNIVAVQSVTIEHYVDIVGGGSGAGNNMLPIVDVNVEYKAAVGRDRISVPSASATYTSYTAQGSNDSVTISGRATPTSGDYFPRFLYDGGTLSTTSTYSNFVVQFSTLRYNYIRLEGQTPSSANYMTVSGTYELYAGDTLVYTRSVSVGLAAGEFTNIIDPSEFENIEFDRCIIKINSTAATKIRMLLDVSLQYNCNAIEINTNGIQVMKINGNYDIRSINNKPCYMGTLTYSNKTLVLLSQENQQTVHYKVIDEM